MDIVDNCNLRCPFCVYDYSNTYRTNFMSDEIFDAAIRLIPYVGNEYFWLSCLHGQRCIPSSRISSNASRMSTAPRYFFTSNLTRRMPQQYYDTLAAAASIISTYRLNPAMPSFPNDVERALVIAFS